MKARRGGLRGIPIAKEKNFQACKMIVYAPKIFHSLLSKEKHLDVLDSLLQEVGIQLEKHGELFKASEVSGIVGIGIQVS